MVEKSQDIEMDKSVAVGNVENNSEKNYFLDNFHFVQDKMAWEEGRGIRLGWHHVKKIETLQSLTNLVPFTQIRSYLNNPFQF